MRATVVLSEGSMGLMTKGQADFKQSSLIAAWTGGRDAASVKIHDMFGDGKPKSEAPLLARRVVFLLDKPREDFIQELRGDTFSRITNGESRGVLLAIERKPHPSALRRELQGVVQKIPDDLADAMGIDHGES